MMDVVQAWSPSKAKIQVSTVVALEPTLKQVKALQMAGPASERKMSNSSLELLGSYGYLRGMELGCDVEGVVGRGDDCVRAEREAYRDRPKMWISVQPCLLS